MSINIRYPNITALNEREQVAQIKSYLHQLVDQLNYGLANSGTGQTESSQTYSVQGGELSYYELRSLIVQQIQEAERLFDQLSAKMEAEYLKNEKLPEAIDQALAQAKDSGEFDGEDGYTPIKGEDYFTRDEITSVATQAAGRIAFTLDENGNLYYEVEE